MSIFRKLFSVVQRRNRSGSVDVSETVAEVVGGGLLGVALGEIAEEGVKVVKKEVAKKRAAPKKPKKVT